MFVDLVGPHIPQMYTLQTYYKDINVLKCGMCKFMSPQISYILIVTLRHTIT